MDTRTGSWTPWPSLPLTRGWSVLLNTGTTGSPKSSSTKPLMTAKRNILISRSAGSHRGEHYINPGLTTAARTALTQPIADTRPRPLGEGENARPAVGEVAAGGHARGIEPARRVELVGVGPPDAREAVDGARGDVDHLALSDRDFVQDAFAVRRADRPPQRDHVVLFYHLLRVGG